MAAAPGYAIVAPAAFAPDLISAIGALPPRAVAAVPLWAALPRAQL